MRRTLIWLTLWPAIIVLPACVGKLPPSGVILLKQIDTTYRAGDFRGTVSRTDSFLASYGNTEAAGEAYYLRGLAYAALKDRARAKADFEDAVKNASRSDLEPLAEVSLGNLAFEQGQMATAAQHYQAVAEKLPNDSPKDVVLYRLGQCHARQGRWHEAQGWFAQLVHLFPASSYEPLARRYLAVDGYTIQCGAYLEFGKAQRQVEELRRAGLPARWVQDSRMKYHLVQVGLYPTWQEARGGLAQVLRIVPDAIIVP
ncbi:MAG: tetratricopeptide repeat protein [Phycisphaerae bacterium]|nr:tetratricopeptide repeat protein [Phycisphaerae bacterium]